MAANNQVLLDKNHTPVGNKVNTKGRIKFKILSFNSRKVAIAQERKHLPVDTRSHKRKDAGMLINKIKSYNCDHSEYLKVYNHGNFLLIRAMFS